MTFELEFDPRAWKEWKKLGDTVRQQFKKKLAEVLERPRVEANRLHGLPDCYKIKLRGAGYRLVYQVQDDRVLVFRGRGGETRAGAGVSGRRIACE
jgi:mRNA interferase RelE/StbE